MNSTSPRARILSISCGSGDIGEWTKSLPDFNLMIVIRTEYGKPKKGTGGPSAIQIFLSNCSSVLSDTTISPRLVSVHSTTVMISANLITGRYQEKFCLGSCCLFFLYDKSCQVYIVRDVAFFYNNTFASFRTRRIVSGSFFPALASGNNV